MQDHQARGHILRHQGRYEEAESFFKQAIAAEPDSDAAYAELALCQLEQEGRKKDALDNIDRAIRIEPEADYYHALRSLILSRLHRGREALTAADTAVAIDPDSGFNYAVKAQALAEQLRWAEAEEYCRKALAQDSDNSFAANLLASVLRMQGKQVESEFAASRLLADDPEDAFAHFNAGWAALQRHDHRTAEGHFREALRLDADFDAAREGLLESFKARSLFYRAYLRYCFWIQRFTAGTQWAIIIGLYLAYTFGRTILNHIHPLAGVAVVILYLGFGLWVWLAPGIGSFLVLLDRSARHALKSAQAWQGIAVGGGVFLGILLLAGSAITHYPPGMVLGGALFAASLPASLTFGNRSRKGRMLFGAITAFVYLAGLGVTVTEAFRHPAEFSGRSGELIFAGIIAAVLCTWIGNVPSLRRDDSG